jgi:hypothetical protein
MKPHLLLLVPLTVSPAIAGDRTSANYAITTDTTDAGGLHAASAGYANDGSASGIAGISTAAAPAASAKHGFIAQLYEIAGLIPTDPLSRFLLRIVPDPVEPGHMHLIFSPIVAGRVYTVESTTSLAPDSWSELADPLQSDSNDERTVTDTHATGPNKFYHVGIAKP